MQTIDTRIVALAGALVLGAWACSSGSDSNNANANATTPTTPVDMPADEGGGESDMEPDEGSTEPDMGPDMEPDMAREVPDGEEVRAEEFFLFPPVPLDCVVPQARYRMPFAIPTDKVRPAVLGDFVTGRKLLPNTSFDLSKLESHRVRLQTLDYNAEGCTSDAQCDPGFRCLAAGLPTSTRHCGLPTGAVFVQGSVRQDYDPGIYNDSRQLVSMLIENTSSSDGRLITDVGSLFGPDPAGGVDLVKDLFVDETRATDRTLLHREGIQNFMLNLSSVADPTKSRVSAWFYGGDIGARARPLTEPMSNEDHFTTDLSLAADLIENDIPNPLPQPNNLYQSILRVLEVDMAPSKYDGWEKFLYVYTDGYNEVHDDAATAQTVIERANALGVHLFIVHLDAAIDDSKLRDLPSVWGGNMACRMDSNCAGAPACGGPDDCASWQSCRPAKVYPEEATGAIADTPASYCMPNYVEGRLGPIDAYANIACQTGGNYIYIDDVRKLAAPLRQLPYVIDGQWSVEMDFSLLSERRALGKGFYQLSGIFTGGFGNISFPATLAAPAPGDTVRLDTRQVIRLGRP